MKEKFQEILEKIYPNSCLEIIGYESPSKNYRTHNTYIVSYKRSENEGKVVVKALSANPRKILHPRIYRLKEEAILLKRINEEGKVKVPKLLYFDESQKILNTPFFVMEYIDGCSLERLPLQERRANLRKMVNVVVDIHSSDFKKFGFLAYSNFGEFIIQELERTIEVARTTTEVDKIKFSEKVVKELKKKIPRKTDIALLHGDLELGHFLLDKTENMYVLDWDAAMVGDRSWDIFWMMKGYANEIYGESTEKIVQYYQDATKHELLNPNFYEISALLMTYLYWVYIIKNEPFHPYRRIAPRVMDGLVSQIENKLI